MISKPSAPVPSNLRNARRLSTPAFLVSACCSSTGNSEAAIWRIERVRGSLLDSEKGARRKSDRPARVAEGLSSGENGVVADREEAALAGNSVVISGAAGVLSRFLPGLHERIMVRRSVPGSGS